MAEQRPAPSLGRRQWLAATGATAASGLAGWAVPATTAAAADAPQAARPGAGTDADPPKTLRYAFRTAETGFDPSKISDLYSRICTAHMFEALFCYDHLARPAKVKPLTAAALRLAWMWGGCFEGNDGAMGIDYIVDLDCAPKRALTVEGLMGRLKGRDRAEKIIQLYRDQGDMRPPQQMAFEIHGLILALHYEARFLKKPGSMERAKKGFDNILARYGVPAAS